ncbi:MAG: nucleotide-diphospho-sugar transferase [Bacteroidota bacterium]
MFNTPILFLIFNRPDVTTQVFAKIREVKPKYLYIAADGPRKERDNEIALCEETRKLVLNTIDWDCEVKTLFRENNLGCGLAVSGAITWFFENVEEGIVLEDDCLPDLSFFRYSEEMLSKYRYDEKVMHIGGNFYKYPFKITSSFFKTRYVNVWGWATWRRAWNNYSLILDEKYDSLFVENNIINQYWRNIIKELRDNRIDTWDYQWFFSVKLNGGCSISPNVNLIKNIGFARIDATHTSNYPTHINSEIGSIDFSRINKYDIIEYEKYDKFIENILVPKKSFIKLIISQFRYFKNKWIK